MPDPTYKTFLSPGSCQLEITDLVASANDDTGVDLYGVAWEIEQVIIAGEGFAASPTDVWVNERGILNIGQSLFDKINRTANDNDNIPGQCTVVVKATSLVDSSKIARLKVLVGYPGEGGGGGGGVDVGAAIPVVYAADAPVAESSDYEQDASYCVVSVLIGDSLIAQSGDNTIDFVAAGCTVIAVNDQAGIKLYKCACSGSMVRAVTELTSIEVTTEDYGGGYYGQMFTIPDTLTATDAIWIAPTTD